VYVYIFFARTSVFIYFDFELKMGNRKLEMKQQRPFVKIGKTYFRWFAGEVLIRFNYLLWLLGFTGDVVTRPTVMHEKCGISGWTKRVYYDNRGRL